VPCALRLLDSQSPPWCPGKAPPLHKPRTRLRTKARRRTEAPTWYECFYLTHDETPTDTQEIVNLLRATADIQRVFPYHARGAIALRGNPAQIALAEWLFSQLDKPVDPQTAKAAAYEFPEPGGGVDAVRVFYLTRGEGRRTLKKSST